MTTLKDFIGLNNPIGDLPESVVCARQNFALSMYAKIGELKAVASDRLWSEEERIALSDAMTFCEKSGGAHDNRMLAEGKEAESIQNCLRAKMITDNQKKKKNPPDNPRDFEVALQNLGYSARQSKRLAASGFKRGTVRDE